MILETGRMKTAFQNGKETSLQASTFSIFPLSFSELYTTETKLTPIFTLEMKRRQRFLLRRLFNHVAVVMIRGYTYGLL